MASAVAAVYQAGLWRDADFVQETLLGKGTDLPGILFTKGKALKVMIKQFATGMTMTEAGVFGTPLFTAYMEIWSAL